MKTYIRVAMDTLKKEHNDTLIECGKRFAESQFKLLFPDEPIRGLGTYEIDTVKREIVFLIVWN